MHWERTHRAPRRAGATRARGRWRAAGARRSPSRSASSVRTRRSARATGGRLTPPPARLRGSSRAASAAPLLFYARTHNQNHTLDIPVALDTARASLWSRISPRCIVLYAINISYSLSNTRTYICMIISFTIITRTVLVYALSIGMHLPLFQATERGPGNRRSMSARSARIHGLCRAGPEQMRKNNLKTRLTLSASCITVVKLYEYSKTCKYL